MKYALIQVGDDRSTTHESQQGELYDKLYVCNAVCVLLGISPASEV